MFFEEDALTSWTGDLVRLDFGTLNLTVADFASVAITDQDNIIAIIS